MIKSKKCKHGVFMFLEHDFIGESLDAYGEYSESEVEIFDHFINPGDVVLDIGAHIGTHTIPFAKKVGFDGRVIAFEPQRYIFYHLCGNVALNELMNVDCYNVGIGKEVRDMTVPWFDYRQRDNWGGVTLKNCKKGYQVPQTTIDELQLLRVDFIKADVEDMEPDVLLGGKDTIQEFMPVLNVESLTNTDQLFDIMHGWGYKTHSYKADLFNPRNFAKNRNNILEPKDARSYGILGLPPGVEIDDVLDKPLIQKHVRSPIDPPKVEK